MLGDLNIAEPKALIGFAGPRVIEQTIRQKLPEGFQRSEFLLEHGFVDLVVDRREMKATIARALRFMLANAPRAPSRGAGGSSGTGAWRRHDSAPDAEPGGAWTAAPGWPISSSSASSSDSTRFARSRRSSTIPSVRFPSSTSPARTARGPSAR